LLDLVLGHFGNVRDLFPNAGRVGLEEYREFGLREWGLSSEPRQSPGEMVKRCSKSINVVTDEDAKSKKPKSFLTWDQDAKDICALMHLGLGRDAIWARVGEVGDFIVERF
jgi:hypothetical protein